MNVQDAKNPDFDPKNAHSDAGAHDNSSEIDETNHDDSQDEADSLQPNGEMIEQWHVDELQAGQRLDLAIGDRLDQSRQQVKTLLQQGAVSVNGRVVSLSRKGYLLNPGTSISVKLPDAQGEWQIIPEPDLPLNIISQGNGYVVVDKPAGMPVHPLEPDEKGTLLNAIIARFPDVQGIGEAGLRSGVVHRLDVDTSGLLIVATEQKRWQLLRAAFSQHTAHKRYTAIVKGHPAPEGMHRSHLIIAQHRPARVKVLVAGNDDSRWCDLSWRVIKKLPNASVLDITLGTGFLHQIRVMMASLGHDVAGDRVYGTSRWKVTPPGLMLHAHALHIGSIHATCEPPKRMLNYMDHLTAAANKNR